MKGGVNRRIFDFLFSPVLVSKSRLLLTLCLSVAARRERGKLPRFPHIFEQGIFQSKVRLSSKCPASSSHFPMFFQAFSPFHFPFPFFSAKWGKRGCVRSLPRGHISLFPFPYFTPESRSLLYTLWIMAFFPLFRSGNAGAGVRSRFSLSSGDIYVT